MAKPTMVYFVTWPDGKIVEGSQTSISADHALGKVVKTWLIDAYFPGVEIGGRGDVGFLGGVDGQALDDVRRQEGGQVAGGLAGAGGEDQAVDGRGGDEASEGVDVTGGGAGVGEAGVAGGLGGGVADGEDGAVAQVGRQGGEGGDAVGAGEGQGGDRGEVWRRG